MAAAVLVPLSTINQNGGILPASALTQHAPRHGRSRGMSLKGKSAKGRAYSVIDDTDVSTAKAVSFLLKRAIKEDEVESGDVENTYVVSDAEGWVTVSDLLLHSNLLELGVDLEGIHSAAASPRARFTLRQKPGSDPERAESYQARQNAKRDSLQLPALGGLPLTSESEGLPEYVVYETTYQAYPRILAFGGIKRAEGAACSSFCPVNTAAEEGEPAAARNSDADVSIWVHLGTAMEQAPGITWQLTPSGSIVTSAEVPKHLWKKVVGRRQDVGLLFEDGQVHNEVPEYLRGKGGKGKAKKGKGHLRQEGRVASESDSNNSDEM